MAQLPEQQQANAQQTEKEKRETLMELEHAMAASRLTEQEREAKLKEAKQHTADIEEEYIRVREELTKDVANANQQRRKEDRIPQQQNGQGEVSQNFNTKGSETNQSVEHKEQQERAKVESQQVKNSNPHPVLRPSYAAGVDRQAHLNAKTIDHQRAMSANKPEEASLDGLAARLNEKAGVQIENSGLENNQSQQQSSGVER